MELSKQSWDQIITMPVRIMYDYIKWKIDLEEKKQKKLEEETNGGKNLSMKNNVFK